MPEVAEDLVPTDGLTNSSIKLAGLDVIPGGARLRFEISDEDQSYVGTFAVTVGAMPQGTVDAMIAEGYRQMKDVVRQWLHGLDVMHKAYSKR